MEKIDNGFYDTFFTFKEKSSMNTLKKESILNPIEWKWIWQ